MLVMCIGYAIWGFIAPRFAARTAAAAPAANGRSGAAAAAGSAAVVAMFLASVGASPADAAALARVKDTSRIALGYRVDARPFSYRDEAGAPAGFAVALCTQVANAVKAELGLASLAVEWVPVTLDDQFQALQQGRVDLLCDGNGETLARRKDVAFSQPIFPGGVGALLRTDASYRLREVLARGRQAGPFWRASPAQILEQQAFSVVNGSTAARWLPSRANELQIAAKIAPVDSYDAGVKRVVDRGTNVLFGERAMLIEAAKRSPSARDLEVLDRLFTFEPVALAMARNDDDFRLLVDRALSKTFASAAFSELYAKSFGAPAEATREFYRWNTLPE